MIKEQTDIKRVKIRVEHRDKDGNLKSQKEFTREVEEQHG